VHNFNLCFSFMPIKNEPIIAWNVNVVDISFILVHILHNVLLLSHGYEHSDYAKL